MSNNMIMKKFAYFDADVVTPEEIIMAAGFTPIRLLGDPTIEYDKVNEHIPPTHCVWARNVLEQALRGLDPEIEGVVTSHGCDCTNREFDIWLQSVKIKFLFFLNVPLKRDELSLKFFISDMKELISQMEETFSIEILSENITKAIIQTNKIRKILREISEYRNKSILKGSEFHELVKKAQISDKNEVLTLLEGKISELKEKKPFTDKKLKRILLTGSIIDDTELLKFLEEQGFQIVIDDLCIGTRYFWNQIDENIDPIQALGEYHFTKPIYSTKFPSFKRFDFIEELIGKYQVDGVINLTKKFCEPLLYSNPYFTKKCKELEIPYLFVEMEYSRESYKQLETRFEAFAEMI